MVLYLGSLEGVLRDHCALLQIIRKSCQVWDLESPVSDDQMGIARENLLTVQELLKSGYTEVNLPENGG